MTHNLRAKLSGLRHKGILEDKDYKRLCHALDLEKAEQEPKAIIREAIEDYVCNHLTDTAKAQEILNALQDLEGRGLSAIAEGTPIPDNATPCDFCRYNPPSSTDGKPCCMCPATPYQKGGK